MEPDPPKPIHLDEAVLRARQLDDAALARAFPCAVLLVQSTPELRETLGIDAASTLPAETSLRSSSLAAAPRGEAGTMLAIPVASKSASPKPNRLVVGREAQCDIRLPFISVSKVHAYLWEASPGTWFIQDAGSRNGTRMGYQPVPADKGLALEDRAKVMFGGARATFLLAESFRKELRSRR